MEKHCEDCNYKGYQVIDHFPPFAKAIFCPSCYKICSLCKGERFLKKVSSNGRSFFDSCECQELGKRIDLFNQAKIPSRFTTSLEKKNFTESFLQESYKKSVQFTNNFQPLCKGILFSGMIGCGKTTLITAIAQKIILEKGYSCLFFEFSRLLEEVRNGYQNGATESEFLDEICSKSLLIIDELGKGKNSKWELSIMESLVERRYNAKQTTIFATNFSFTHSMGGEGLQGKITDRAYSRLQEICDFVAIQGKDLRKIPVVAKAESMSLVAKTNPKEKEEYLSV